MKFQPELWTLAVLVSSVLLSPLGFSTPAYAQMICDGDALHSLPTCVSHHYTAGDIDNRGIYVSLLSKAQNAVSLADGGNTDAAINVLNSFINEIQAQSGVHVSQSAAQMLILHAQTAIDELS